MTDDAPPSATLRDLFVRDVTRNIPPVVYFHEQDADKVAAEVDEYIVTGGWPDGHPHKKRVPEGIHEQYVKLLGGIVAELDKPGGPDLPTAWISGFYGSGKSSFAKLMGLALDRHPTMVLPDGRPLHEALLARDHAPRAPELRAAFDLLMTRVSPLAVVFDIGGTARDHEHVHAVAVRQVQRRLGYSTSDPHVADFELRLERDGEWAAFEAKALEVLGRPWSEVKDLALAEEDFSLVLHHLYPDRYVDPMAWFVSRGSARAREGSPQDATAAIRDMRRFRAPDATLFLVVDEVSQYVVGNKDRVDRLRAFANELGVVLRGKVWLVALGQQKLDEQAGDDVLRWMRDRFPPGLQIHLHATNIRDVIHRRLLQKTPAAERELARLFERHRAALKLYAYGASEITPEDFVEVYPLLPNHIDLLLQITSALRLRTTRAQGDDHGIRGVLQLLGELFRSQRLADQPLGALVTFDQIYEVQQTALDSDLQASMARILAATAHADPLLLRCAKVVALLEHIQEGLPTTAELVAQCLYDRIDTGDRTSAVRAALEELRKKNLLGYAEKTGYKVQSSSAEEWEDEKARIGVSREQEAELIKDALARLVPAANRPRHLGRDFPWRATFSTGAGQDEVVLVDARDQAAMSLDLRWPKKDERDEAQWVKKSAETIMRTRLVWIAGDSERVSDLAQELARCREMVQRYRPRRESLVVAKKNLLNNEEARLEDLGEPLKEAVAAAWLAGRMLFDGRPIDPRDHGQAFTTALTAAATRILPEIYHELVPIQVDPSELLQLLDEALTGLPKKFMAGELGLLDIEAGRYVSTATGAVPTRVLEAVRARHGMSGATLLLHFAAPPYAWPVNVVKAAVAGLVRAGKLKIQPEDGAEVTRLRDPGVRALFEKDRAFRGATFFPANEPLDPRFRTKVCRLFQDELGVEVDRDEEKIADAVASLLPGVGRRARVVLARRARVPRPDGRDGRDDRRAPQRDDRVASALAAVVPVIDGLVAASRYTARTMDLLQKDLDILRDGLRQLATLDAELTEAAVDVLVDADEVRRHQGEQLLRAASEHTLDAEVAGAIEAIGTALQGARPWLDQAQITTAVELVRGAYRAERQRLLAWQELEADHARGRLKARADFVGLGADLQHQILRPLAEVGSKTTVDALSPELVALREPFARALERAEERALELLDDALRQVELERARRAPGRAAGAQPPKPVEKAVVKVDLRLRHREVASKEEVDRLVAEIADTLMEHVRAGKRVRLS